MGISFEQLPETVKAISEKVDNIERLLLDNIIGKQQPTEQFVDSGSC